MANIHVNDDTGAASPQPVAVDANIKQPDGTNGDMQVIRLGLDGSPSISTEFVSGFALDGTRRAIEATSRRDIIAIEPTGGIVNTSGSAYAANDNVGGLLTFALGQRAGGGVCVWEAQMTDGHSQLDVGGGALLYLFRAAPTPPVDKMVWTPSAVDLGKIFANRSVNSWNFAPPPGTPGTSPAVWVDTFDQVLGTADDGNIYGVLVCSGAPTFPSTTELQLTLFVELF